MLSHSVCVWVCHTSNLSCRKDPQGIFAEPVTDDIAPGYSALITNPMDFSTMAKKMDNLQYQSVDEYKVNRVVMFVW